MMNQQYTYPQASLEALPAEIKLTIIDWLRADSDSNLKSFAACSRSFFELCLRAHSPTIILNPRNLKVFQEGGLCEQNREYIRSIRVAKWRSPEDEGYHCRPYRACRTRGHTHSDASDVTFRDIRVQDPEGTFSELRIAMEALNLFPNLERLCIAYEIPSAAENNTFVAALKGINTVRPLKHLEFDVLKLLEARLVECYNRSKELYEELCKELSPTSREFLGVNRISDDEVDNAVRASLPDLSALTSYGLCANSITTPTVSQDDNIYQRTRFYYHPILAANQATALRVETTDREKQYHNYWFSQTRRDPPVTASPTNDGLVFGIPGLRTLDITTGHLLYRDEFTSLVDRFPNLENLHIRMFPRRHNGYYWGMPTDVYHDIRRLTKLRHITLPWTEQIGGKFQKQPKLELCVNWRNAWFPNLGSARFTGLMRLSEDVSYSKDIQSGVSWPGIVEIEVRLAKMGDCEDGSEAGHAVRNYLPYADSRPPGSGDDCHDSDDDDQNS